MKNLLMIFSIFFIGSLVAKAETYTLAGPTIETCQVRKGNLQKILKGFDISIECQKINPEDKNDKSARLILENDSSKLGVFTSQSALTNEDCPAALSTFSREVIFRESPKKILSQKCVDRDEKQFLQNIEIFYQR